MLKVYPDFETAKKNGEKFTIAELVKFLNDQKSVLTLEQANAVNKELGTMVESYNNDACANKCVELCNMERSQMWRAYAPNPNYMGIKVVTDAKTGALTTQDAKMPIKFKALEHCYQVMNSVETDDEGKPRPNPAVTLCSNGDYSKLVMLFNGLLVDETIKDVGATALTHSKKFLDYMSDKDNGLSCFIGPINKGKRIAQLQTIWEHILPADLASNVTALSCDVSFLKKKAFRPKDRSINGIGDGAMMDAIIASIACGLSFDGDKRTLKYTVTSKSKAFVPITE